MDTYQVLIQTLQLSERIRTGPEYSQRRSEDSQLMLVWSENVITSNLQNISIRTNLFPHAFTPRQAYRCEFVSGKAAFTHSKLLYLRDQSSVCRKIILNTRHIFGNGFIDGARDTQSFPHMVTGQFTKGILRLYLVQSNLRHFSEHFHFSSLCPFMKILTPPHCLMDQNTHPGSEMCSFQHSTAHGL